MLYMLRLCVSLESEAGIFWWMPGVPKSGGLPWSRLCSAQVQIRLFLLLLGQVVVWSLSWSGRQICCRPILMESSPLQQPFVPQSHYFAFRSWEVKWLLLDLDSYGGTDPLGMFPLFWRTAEVLAPHLTVVFWWFFRLDSFPVCWRVANVTPIPKGPQHPIIEFP